MRVFTVLRHWFFSRNCRPRIDVVIMAAKQWLRMADLSRISTDSSNATNLGKKGEYALQLRLCRV